MGHNLSIPFTHYGYDAVVIDKRTNEFRGLRKREGDQVIWTGSDPNDPNLDVLPLDLGTSLFKVQLFGPTDSFQSGSLEYTDTNGKIYPKILFSIKTTPLQDPSTYQPYYSSPSFSECISSLGLTVLDSGLTVICDTSSTIAPVKRSISIHNAGFTGWILDQKSNDLVGFIQDGGEWSMLSDVTALNLDSYTACYFETGYLLSNIRIVRKPSTKTNELGSSTIEMIASNGVKYSSIYTAIQSNTLSVNSSFSTKFPSMNDSSDVGLIITKFDYFVVPGATSLRLDWLVSSVETGLYTKPNDTSYGTPAIAGGSNYISKDKHNSSYCKGEVSHSSYHHKTMNRNALCWALTGAACCALVVGGSLWIYRKINQKKKSEK